MAKNLVCPPYVLCTSRCIIHRDIHRERVAQEETESQADPSMGAKPSLLVLPRGKDFRLGDIPHLPLCPEMHMHPPTFMHICTPACTQTCSHMPIHIYVNTHTCTYTQAPVYMHTHTYAHTCAHSILKSFSAPCGVPSS